MNLKILASFSTFVTFQENAEATGISLVPINGGLVAPSRVNHPPLTPEETRGRDTPDGAISDELQDAEG